MSNTRSLFSRGGSRKNDRLSSSSHELPRWRTPSPMAASVIPPPIVQSTYALPQRHAAQPVVMRKPTPQQDRQSELEADLQYLLDAQADGLLGGLESGVSGLIDDRASNGSTTPTAQSVRSTSARTSVRRKPGVRSARKGIHNSIVALSTVKAEELEDIDDEVRSRDQTIEKIDGWQEKRQRLREASKNLDSNEDTVRSQRLRQEADVLQEEINHVELQLADMKARQRKLLREVAAAENAVQAKMASYTSSLRLLEEEVQQYLSTNPGTPTPQRKSDAQSATVWQLPPKRRTLDMAKQYWSDERSMSEQQRESVRLEKTALDEGAVMWKEAVISISDFERTLRMDMAKQAEERTAPGLSASSSPLQHDQRCSHEVLEQMDRLISALQKKFELARERNWNLLIAAIGAEIDALKQGRLLLGGESASEEPSDEQPDAAQSASPDHDLDLGSEDELQASAQSSATARRHTSNGVAPEDDPDPELLFSRHDLDSE
ncbi:uncharacterized protein LTR77_003378 [Saxophila tyrrhenica]|uniref:Atg28p n=1 Tax=Saxophila tyrrhenica TaxID=1690608 RepID=A0AAV9PEL9_9PEZI|nr:hypothetical protein LTR77_003378 [Saxophila tyrrhenica]